MKVNLFCKFLIVILLFVKIENSLVSGADDINLEKRQSILDIFVKNLENSTNLNFLNSSFGEGQVKIFESFKEFFVNSYKKCENGEIVPTICEDGVKFIKDNFSKEKLTNLFQDLLIKTELTGNWTLNGIKDIFISLIKRDEDHFQNTRAEINEVENSTEVEDEKIETETTNLPFVTLIPKAAGSESSIDLTMGIVLVGISIVVISGGFIFLHVRPRYSQYTYVEFT